MAGGLTGSLEQWPLPELLNMLGSSRQSGQVEVEAGDMRGSVYLQEGNIVHAVAPQESGIAALTSLFGLHAGTFSFEPRVPAPATTLSQPLDALLAEVTREATEREAILAVVGGPGMHPRLSLETPPEAITIQPSDWRLVAAANGSTAISAIADALGIDLGTLMRGYYALGQRGLVDFEAPPANVIPMHVPVPRVIEEPETFEALAIADEEPEAVEVPVPVNVAAQPAPAPAPAVPAPVVQAAPPTPSVAAAPVPIVDEQFFRELARASAAALGPLAAVIVEDAVEAFGVPVNAFPRSRAAHLVEVVAREIKDDRRRADFQAYMLRFMREMFKAA